MYKLNKNDKIKIIAPANSLFKMKDENKKIAEDRFKGYNLQLEYSENSYKYDECTGSSSIEDRIEDLHEAFKQKDIKAIICASGGYNCNQLLDYIDYNLIDRNKIIVGYSDITALLNAIHKMTGMITYLGPTYSSFSMKKGFDYTEENFFNIINKGEVIVKDSKKYSNDRWKDDQENRNFIKNNGMKIINKGKAEGKIIGGNLCTFNLLQGTKYMPSLKNTILFLEDDDLVGEYFSLEFERNLHSLISQKDFKYVKGIIIGRTQDTSNMDINKWKKILDKKELKNIPIIIDLDFGHTTPMLTIPIGGYCKIDTESKDKVILYNKKFNK